MQQQKSFTAYYTEWKDKLYSYILYKVGDTALAQDLTQDIWLKAYNAFARYDGKHAFSTWIYTIANNTITDHWRKKKIEFADMEEDFEIGDDAREADMMKRQTSAQIEIVQVHQALQKLPQLQQDAILMKYIEDAHTRDIAERLDTSEANVRQALSRGMKRLREVFGDRIELLIILALTPPWL